MFKKKSHSEKKSSTAKTGKQWRVEALMEAMDAVSHIDEARRIIKRLIVATDESALTVEPGA